MKNRPKTRKVLHFIFLCVTLFFLIGLGQFLTTKEKQQLHQYIPSSVGVALKVNNKRLMHRLGFDFLFFIDENPWEDLKKTPPTPPTSTGIDIQQEIILFLDYFPDTPFLGALVHVINEHKFQHFIANQTSIIGNVHGNIGCLLLVPENADSVAMNYFNAYVNDATLKNKDRTKTKSGLANSHPKGIFHAYIQGQENGLVQDLNIQGFLDQNKVRLTGSGKKNPVIDLVATPKHFIYETEEENALEIRAGQLADTVQGFLSQVLFQNEFEFPEISTQHYFFYGFDLVQVNNRTLFLPRFDGIIHFKDTLPESFLNLYPKQIIDSSSNNEISLGSSSYFIHTLNETELYIGKTQFPKLVYYTPENYISVHGDLSAILLLEGNGFMAQVANALPPVKNARNFLNSIQEFYLSTQFKKSGDVRLESQLIFDKNKTASLEIMKFLMRF